ncbi:MAG TPA: MmcQ/YjbR family DNA-binding protein [Phototrophicaceae bacterium]|nr:MmcQ/YjbR family DNA-binding protein [Phototrophicaceae bacterium]
MNRSELVAYCLVKKGATSGQPFGPDVDVMKVLGKVFALIPVSSEPVSISLKCDPVFAEILRETYPAVTAGYHLNKRHWNSIVIDGSVPDDELEEWIDHSYEQVVKHMTKAERAQLDRLKK